MKASDSRIDDAVLYQWGNEELTSSHQARFLKHFAGLSGTILEIGSGRGIMLEMLRKSGCKAYGIDLSQQAVDACRARGLEAVSGDALEHLRTLAAESLGGIFCAHVIEHMHPAEAIELIAQSHRVLMPGGRMVFVTPNAKDLRTTERFWLDVTHVRPYPEKLMHMLLNRQGFTCVESYSDVEPARNTAETIAKKFLYLWFMGYMFTGDLVVVATK